MVRDRLAKLPDCFTAGDVSGTVSYLTVYVDCLARSANLLIGLYFFTFSNFFFFYYEQSGAISVSTGPIFTIVLPNGRDLREFS